MTTTETATANNVRLAQILLVEDNAGDALLVKEALGAIKLANNLSVASDGEQALRMLRRQEPYTDHPRPDLVLLDLNLPRVDGPEVLQAVKSDPELRDIPVIVLSGSQALRDIEMSHGFAANGYVIKPVNLECLKEIVGSIEHFWFSVVVMSPTPEVAREC